MRTICYVDGYNLFYGALKHTPYKWLDLPKLLHEKIVSVQDPEARLERIKYFTADIKAKVANRGQQALHAQHAYLRALETRYPAEVEIIKGYYSLERANALRFQKPPDKNDRVEVWKLEEKQTDVNIALTAYRDVAKGLVDQLVFVSNDTDIVPALAAIREDFDGKCRIGVVIPVRRTDGEVTGRPGNRQLSELADWTRHYIREEELAACAFPDMIPTNRKPIRKPDYW